MQYNKTAKSGHLGGFRCPKKGVFGPKRARYKAKLCGYHEFDQTVAVGTKSSTSGPSVVNCPTIWSLLFIFGFLCWSSSWRWQPHIGVCRLLWPLLRAQMAVLTQFFCKMYFLYVSRSRKKIWATFFCVFPLKKAVFCRGSLICQISRNSVLAPNSWKWLFALTKQCGC